MPQHSFSSQRILPDIRLRHSVANQTRKRIPHLHKEVVKPQHVDLCSILAKSFRRIGGNFTTIHSRPLSDTTPRIQHLGAAQTATQYVDPMSTSRDLYSDSETTLPRFT
jgi:hypothetical protein